MSQILFAQTKLPMLGKKGVTKPDENGYYTLVIAGLNTHNNSKSWYYTAEGVRELFGPGSLLHRRVANGCLRAEVNHPRRMPGEKDDAFIARQLDIDLNNTCAHFAEIWLDENFGKNHPEYKNPDLIAVMAKVKPTGPKAAILKEALENNCENICFSIRAIADQMLVRGKVIRVLKEIITIDLVNEGGITVASKWDSPATESINEEDVHMVTKRLLERVYRSSGADACVATESSREMAQYLSEKYFHVPKAPTWSQW